MSNSYFAFKQFVVRQDRCAMKVGTDGVLLGAWANVEGARRVLDIGAGTGLVALMAAQRNPLAEITGVEIDGAAARQAHENAAESPWAARIRIVEADVRTFSPGWRFDAIVSNPPYYTNALRCADAARDVARRTDGLPFAHLVAHAARLLETEGEFSVIVPAEEVGLLVGLGLAHGLCLSRRTWVRTTPQKEAKRCLLAFRPKPVSSVADETLVVQTAPGAYGVAYLALTRDFYLER